jgi:peptidyl-prolyl cis-trans isomerase B (cyclophilin B)
MKCVLAALLLWGPQDSEAVRALKQELQKVKNRIPELQKLGQQMREKDQKAGETADPALKATLKTELEQLKGQYEALQKELMAAADAVSAGAKAKIAESPKDLGLYRLRLEALRMVNRTEEALADIEAIAAITGKSDDWLDAARQYLQVNRFERARELAHKVLALDAESRAAREVGGQAAFALHDWEGARGFLKPLNHPMLASVDECERLWGKEQSIRFMEATAADNPRVKVTTSRGVIELELFETHAPNTVANFVELAEKKFYDGLTFHRVISNFMAQGGCPEGTGRGGPGYRFADETTGEFRRHFRGTLSMANGGANTNGSQFFITHLPTPHLNGRHTVFGRVVAGQEVADALKVGDKIERVEVTRKRPHEYKVKRLP